MKILGYNYRIERGATVAEIDAHGRQHPRTQVIQIASDLTEEGESSALLHEVLEALNYHLQLGLEHKVLMALEAGLFQVLTDNGVDLAPLGVRVTYRNGIVEAEDYTPKIHACIADLGYKMDQVRIPYKEEDILVLRHGDDVYVLANPVLGSEPIYDEFGRVVDHVPLRNLTMIWQEDWLNSRVDSDCFLFEVICPRLRVLRPELCTRLGSSGEVVGELQRIIEEEEVRLQTEGLEQLLCGLEGDHGT